MPNRFHLFVSGFAAALTICCVAQTSSHAKFLTPSHDVCSRPAEGSPVVQPRERRSKNGFLRVSLVVHSSTDQNGYTRFCYTDEQGNQAPTLHVQPGDMLEVRFKNEISLSLSRSTSSAAKDSMKHLGPRGHDPCAGGAMTEGSTNLHFHGLAVAPVCHQDETLKTHIEPGDPPFDYRFQIPKQQPPGLYWYHPHVHGYGEDQLLGGASGALIVDGIEQVVPAVAGLPARVLVIRDQKIPAPTIPDKPDAARPTKQLSINYVPVPYPKYPPAVITMRPHQREFWRVLNASADTYVNLYVEFSGRRQKLALIALDGVPLQYGERSVGQYTPETSFIFLPPAARAEFIISSPHEGESGRLMTTFVDRGSADDDGRPYPSSVDAGVRAGQDDVDAARPLAAIIGSAQARDPALIQQASVPAERSGVPLSGVRPSTRRKLYFSERLSDPSDPNSATLFFVTEEGHTPAVFNPVKADPDITVHQGDVEDWTIENRSRESHTFHVHQLHFIVVGVRAAAWEEPTLRDTVNLPAWSGLGEYPSLTLRMDFRDPAIVGTIPFHCHIAQHSDGGMMGTIRIEPIDKKVNTATKMP